MAVVRTIHSSSPSGAVHYDIPQPRAGEIVLTLHQKLALLIMRQSDLSKAILAGVLDKTHDGPAWRDFTACVSLGLAVNKGRFHVLTNAGRWRADCVARDVAREFGLHIVTYDYGGYGRAAYVTCTCGWRAFKSRAIPNYVIALGRAAHAHTVFVGGAR